MSKTIKLKQEPKPEKVKTTYDEKSPITGNFTVMTELIENEDIPEGSDLPKHDMYKICMETGYQTYWETWKESNVEFIKHLEGQMPSWIANYRYVDSYKRIWYPMLAVSYVATLHPFPESDGQLGWAVAEMSLITDEKDLESNSIIKLPIETLEGPKLALYKVDNENAKTWKFNEFESAFDYYQSIVTDNSNINDAD
jgi:hypothetical protein